MKLEQSIGGRLLGLSLLCATIGCGSDDPPAGADLDSDTPAGGSPGECELPVEGYYAQDGCLEFGQIRTGYGYHVGDDYCAAAGTEIHPIADGVVKAVATRDTVATNWGPIVLVEHTLADGAIVCAIYGHVEAAAGVNIGDVVIGGSDGTLLGTIHDGVPDLSSWANHVHFGVYDGSCAEIACNDVACGARGYLVGTDFPGSYTEPVAFVDACEVDSSSATITVDYPSLGDRVFVGSTQEIRWSSSGLSADDVCVRIWHGPAHDASTDASVDVECFGDNDGLILDVVFDEANFPLGDDYYVAINDSAGRAFALGDQFSVLVEPRITVVAPGAGDAFQLGDGISIAWTSQGVATSVNTRFYRGPVGDASAPELVTPVEAPGDNDGTIEGVVLSDDVFFAGDDWYVCVDDGSTAGCSGHFSISEPSSGIDLVVSGIWLGIYTATVADFVDIGSFTLGNEGDVAPIGDVSYRVYASADANVTTSDTQVNESSAVNPLAVAPETVTGGWATAFPASTVGVGTWYVGIVIDPDDVYPESDESNNVTADPIPVVIAP